MTGDNNSKDSIHGKADPIAQLEGSQEPTAAKATKVCVGLFFMMDGFAAYAEFFGYRGRKTTTVRVHLIGEKLMAIQPERRHKITTIMNSKFNRKHVASKLCSKGSALQKATKQVAVLISLPTEQRKTIANILLVNVQMHGLLHIKCVWLTGGKRPYQASLS